MWGSLIREESLDLWNPEEQVCSPGRTQDKTQAPAKPSQAGLCPHLRHQPRPAPLRHSGLTPWHSRYFLDMPSPGPSQGLCHGHSRHLEGSLHLSTLHPASQTPYPKTSPSSFFATFFITPVTSENYMYVCFPVYFCVLHETGSSPSTSLAHCLSPWNSCRVVPGTELML